MPGPLPNPDNDKAGLLKDLEAAEKGDQRAIATIRALLGDMADEGPDRNVIYLGYALYELWRNDDAEEAEMN